MGYIHALGATADVAASAAASVALKTRQIVADASSSCDTSCRTAACTKAGGTYTTFSTVGGNKPTGWPSNFLSHEKCKKSDGSETCWDTITQTWTTCPSLVTTQPTQPAQPAQPAPVATQPAQSASGTLLLLGSSILVLWLALR